MQKDIYSCLKKLKVVLHIKHLSMFQILWIQTHLFWLSKTRLNNFFYKTSPKKVK